MLAVNLWSEPIPTFANLINSGVPFNAFSGVEANFITLFVTLIANTLDGNLLVTPIPTKSVGSISIDSNTLLLSPEAFGLYVSDSPVTKK